MSESLDDVIARALAARGRTAPAGRRASGDPDLMLLLGDGSTTPYGASALAGACAEVRAAGPGQRNHELNRQAFKVGQLVARGVVNGREAVAELRQAGLDTGLPPHEVNLVLRGSDTGAVKAGQDVPRDVELRGAAGDADLSWQAPPWVTEAVDQPTNRPTVPPSGQPTVHPSMVGRDQPTNQPTGAPPAGPSTPPPADGPAPELTAEQREALAREGLLRQELRQQWARREARAQLDAAERASTFRVPPSLPSLADDLALPPEPVQWAVEGLAPAGGNVLLTAQFKAGKTTTVNNLARSFADGEPFLGRFAVHAPATGRIALWNYEVSASQYTEWLRDARIAHPERVVVLNLRGFNLPLTVPHVAAWVIAWLKANDVRWWVLDPFARAYGGASENDNAEVTAWTNAVDAIKEQAGVEVLVLPVHTGRAEFEPGAERARGATRLDDWADVRWLLTRDNDGNRFLRASGRDVEQDEERLTFDEATRRLTFGGHDRRGVARRALEDVVVQVVQATPGINTRRLREAVAGERSAGREALAAAVASAKRYGRISVEDRGREGVLHFPVGHVQPQAVAGVDEGVQADVVRLLREQGVEATEPGATDPGAES